MPRGRCRKASGLSAQQGHFPAACGGRSVGNDVVGRLVFSEDTRDKFLGVIRCYSMDTV